MNPLALLGIGAASVALLGAVGLLVVGLRGRRIDDHPVCRRCRFDLVGVYPGATACPECGRELGPRAVRVGNRRKRAGLVAGGGVILGIAVLLGTIVGVQTARGFNWNTVKPAWLLIFEVSSSDRPGPLRELAARLRRQELDPARLRALVEPILRRQEDAARPWMPELGDLFVAAWEAGAATPEQARRFAMAGTNVEMTATYSANGSLLLRAAATRLRGTNAAAMFVRVRPVSAEIDGAPVSLRDGLGLAFALQSAVTNSRRLGLGKSAPERGELTIRWEASAGGSSEATRRQRLEPWEIVTRAKLAGAGAEGSEDRAGQK